MADVDGAAAEGEHKLDVGEIVPVINTEETKGRLLKSIMISSLQATTAGEPVERRMRLPTERELTEALEARLDLAIMADWQAAMTTRSTRHKLTDATGTLRRRPRDAAAFIRRWGSVCEIVRGRCTPRSRWIDQQGPALTLDVGD